MYSDRVQLIVESNKNYCHSRQTKPVYSKLFLNIAAVRRFSIGMKKNSACTRMLIEFSFWHHQFDLTQIRKPRAIQPFVDINAADIRQIYVTTMKAINSQNDVSSNFCHISKYHFE